MGRGMDSVDDHDVRQGRRSGQGRRHLSARRRAIRPTLCPGASTICRPSTWPTTSAPASRTPPRTCWPSAGTGPRPSATSSPARTCRGGRSTPTSRPRSTACWPRSAPPCECIADAVRGGLRGAGRVGRRRGRRADRADAGAGGVPADRAHLLPGDPLGRRRGRGADAGGLQDVHGRAAHRAVAGRPGAPAASDIALEMGVGGLFAVIRARLAADDLAGAAARAARDRARAPGAARGQRAHRGGGWRASRPRPAGGTAHAI